MKRKIGVVTGSRAEYGYLRPLIKEILKHPKLDLFLYLTGMHLLKEYGETAKELDADRFKIKKTIDMGFKKENTGFDMALSIAKGISGFAEEFRKDKPDILVVMGDRVEPLAATIAAVNFNIPIAHLHGGEVGLGDLDNSIRHAITKFAHIHFTSSDQSKERILKLGEEKWRVFKVGALSLDEIVGKKLLSREEINRKYNLPNKSIILVSYHPVTTEWEDAENQIKTVLKASAEIANDRDMIIIVLYPNAYPGGYEIVKVIRDSQKEKNIFIFDNLPHYDYISLMNSSVVFVGNSSSGIIEAPSLGIPFISVGTRQKGRERAKNVIDADYEKKDIIKGIKKALDDKEFLSQISKKETPYGDGNASQRIVKRLDEIELNKKLLEKKITY